MIKKLRIKLIFAAMISLLAVLVVIMGAVGYLNYAKIVSDADETLTILEENDGFFPNTQQTDDTIDNNEFRHDKESPKRRYETLPPELPFETRYFFVSMDENGDTLSVNTGKIAAIDSETAVEYAKDVWEEGSTEGFIGDYRYLMSTSDGESLIIFLDCGRNLDNFRTLLASCIAVSITGSALVLFLLILLSGRIVKPFSENYEKQKRFITDAGHELKTPLTIIDADAEILTMDFGENEWLSDIQSQTKRLSELTNDLILLSRMEEERTKTQVLDFPLSDVVEETIQSFQSMAKAQEKTLEISIQPLISFRGDEKAIRKLVSLLMDNALKYSEPKGKISCVLKQQKKNIYFSVYNTTEYISKAQTPYLFDRFYRTDQSRNSDTGGYGLGLSIAQAIVSSHKGKITASTTDEHSLTISVILPL